MRSEIVSLTVCRKFLFLAHVGHNKVDVAGTRCSWNETGTCHNWVDLVVYDAGIMSGQRVAGVFLLQLNAADLLS